ncbi:MAG: hypothetical protein EBS01_00215 [Verrucomicrobia bacterium]|nr:hypothetical protein [Verrucomicrobiota bacterium]
MHEAAPPDKDQGSPFTFMGQQSNKVEKRRRRAAYLERLKTRAKEAALKHKVRRPKKDAVAG